jgi:hypothetical protein
MMRIEERQREQERVGAVVSFGSAWRSAIAFNWATNALILINHLRKMDQRELAAAAAAFSHREWESLLCKKASALRESVINKVLVRHINVHFDQ